MHIDYALFSSPYLPESNNMLGKETVITFQSGSEIKKKNSCSSQLRMKFQILTNIKISRNSAIFCGSERPRMLFFLLINAKMPFNIYEQEKFHAQPSS